MIATVLTDKRPVIKVSINGQETAALVDTGASLSIVSESDMGKFKFKRGSKMAGSVIGLDGTEQSMYHTDKNFNFEDFERLTGRWTMPKGFTPQFIEVRLSGSGTPVIKRFSWQRGKPVDVNSAFVSEIPQAEANAQ